MEKSSDTITTIRLKNKQYVYALEVMEFFQISWNDVVKSAMYLLYSNELYALEYLLSRQNKSSMSKEELEMWLNKKVPEKKISVRLNKKDQNIIMYDLNYEKAIEGSKISLTKYLHNALKVIYFPDNEKHIYDKLNDVNVALEQLVKRRGRRGGLGRSQNRIGRSNHIIDSVQAKEYYQPKGIDLSERRYRIGVGNFTNNNEKIKQPSEGTLKRQRKLKNLKEIQNEKIKDLENNIQLLEEWLKESKGMIKNIKKI